MGTKLFLLPQPVKFRCLILPKAGACGQCKTELINEIEMGKHDDKTSVKKKAQGKVLVVLYHCIKSTSKSMAGF